MNPSPQELFDAKRRAEIAANLPELEDELAGMARTTTTQVFQHIRKGTLTPELAYQYWLEIYSYDRLKTRFQTRINTGVNNGSQS